MGYWPTLAKDCDRFYAECEVCLKLRSHPVQGPFRSPLADDGLAAVLPWTHVIIDCQGPFTKAEGGGTVCSLIHVYPTESSVP